MTSADQHAAPASYGRRLIFRIVAMAFRPARTAEALCRDQSKFGLALGAWFLLGSMYTATVLAGWLHGFGAVMQPWLPIPAERYYLWETFFTLPAFLAILVTAAAVMHLAARRLGGTGAFQDTFAAVAVGSVFPTFLLMWLPETAVMVLLPDLRSEPLGGFSFLPGWADAARQLAVPLWTAAIWARALARVQSLTPTRSAMAAAAGLIPAAAVALAVIR